MWCLYRKKAKIKSDDPVWLIEAIKEQGIEEIVGGRHNSRILEYHKYTDLKARTDEVSWCSSFINWCFYQCGLPGTNKASARSWLVWGIALAKPKRGCIAIFWRDSKNSWKGHVGFYMKEDKKYIYVLGGNQSNKVKISRYPKTRLIGYRWP